MTAADTRGPSVKRRTLEISTAVGVALLGAIVSVESLTHDTGWNETGPGPGYFPFRIGLLLVAAAAVRALQSLRVRGSEAFVTRDELRRSISVFWPTALVAGAMIPFGSYAPSVVYLTWMMRRHGGYPWRTSIALGVAVMAAFFLVFEIWFRVPLAKGPIERLVGL